MTAWIKIWCERGATCSSPCTPVRCAADFPVAPAGLADQHARQRLLTEHGRTFFVEAGAGTGKTTTLVGRIVSLVACGRVTMDHLAAITFTEAAAAELRDRVREELERAAVDVSRAP